MKTLRLAPLLALALVAVVLAGCGSESSNRNASGAWNAANEATETFASNGAKYALALQDCTNTASDNAADAACAKEALANVAEAWAPIGTALGVLDKVASSQCKAAITKAMDDGHLIDGKDTSPPTNAQTADALTTQITNAIQQFSQEIAGAKTACV